MIAKFYSDMLEFLPYKACIIEKVKGGWMVFEDFNAYRSWNHKI